MNMYTSILSCFNNKFIENFDLYVYCCHIKSNLYVITLRLFVSSNMKLTKNNNCFSQFILFSYYCLSDFIEKTNTFVL